MDASKIADFHFSQIKSWWCSRHLPCGI